MEGRNCQITIDTGSNISIVRPDVLPESEIQPINQCIRTVTGEKAPIRGKGNLRLRIGSTEIVHPIRIGSTEIVHPTWIADIQDECILGLDFLEPHECLVNLRNGTLQVGEEEIPLQKPAVVTTLTPCRAVLETTVILPPQMCCTCKNGWPVEAQAKVGNYGSWSQKQGSRKCPGRLVGCPNSGRPTSTYHSRENDESRWVRRKFHCKSLPW